MLLIALPTGLTKGTCKINGHEVGFELDEAKQEFAFRKSTTEGWDRRRILESFEEGNHTQLICSSSASPDDGIVIRHFEEEDYNPLSEEDVLELVCRYDRPLAMAWKLHEKWDDILILADVSLPEVRALADSQHGRDRIQEILRHAKAEKLKPFVPMIATFALIRELAASPHQSHKSTAAELKRLSRSARHLGQIPLLLIHEGGIQATTWITPAARRGD